MALSVLFFSPLLTAAQTPLNHYYQDHWTTRDGLPHNTINAITQTAEGYLWFATWEGVARYNGHEFHNFTRGAETGLPGSGLRALTSDVDGLWVAGARGGISHYQHQVWEPQLNTGIMVRYVLRAHDGLLWLATEGDGIYVRQGDQTLKHFDKSSGLPSTDIYYLTQDAEGRIWAGTARGLVWISDNIVHRVDNIGKVPVPALYLDKQNHVLIGSAQGLYKAKGTTVSQIYPELANQSIISLLQDSLGDLWLGTTEQGLLRISALGIETLGVNSGLPEQRVISLFQDSESSIWVGTNAGLMRLRDVPFNSLTEQDGLAGNYVRAVLAHSDGSMYVGSSTGLSQFREGPLNKSQANESKFKTLDLTLPDGTQPSVLSLSQGSADELWVGTFTNGVLRLKHHELVEIFDRSTGLAANEVRAIAPAQDGSVWIGTTAGLNHIVNGQLEVYRTAEGLPSDSILSLHQTINGDIWVGTILGAAFIRDGKIQPVYLNSQDDAEYAFGFYSEPDGQHVWLATDRGLVRYRYADASLALVGNNQGLPVDKIFQPVADHNGGLWLPSNRGVTRISLAAAHRVADGLQDTIEFEHFDERDGMLSSQTNGGAGSAATLAMDGQVWTATALGAARVDPSRLMASPHTNVPVVLETLKVSGEQVSLNGPLILAAGSDRLQFSYAGLGFVMPERIQYRTLLEGFDEDWVLRGTQNSAEYTNLPPGNYVFRVSATYPYESWSAQDTRLALTVLPFIWQLPFFWLIVVTLVAVALWLLLRLRLRFLNFHAQELERQVADKTKELKRQAQAFERQARADSLTGLPNRRAFDEALAAAFMRARRTGAPITLVVIDIDHFKQVNDTWSHEVGDQVLKIMATIIRREIREVDFPARWGGEEFTILLPDTDLMTSTQVAERLRLAVMDYDYSQIAPNFRLSVSLGLAEAQAGMDEAQLLANADLALYQAKHRGRNQVVRFKDSESAAPLAPALIID